MTWPFYAIACQDGRSGIEVNLVNGRIEPVLLVVPLETHPGTGLGTLDPPFVPN